jgi:hypothetical protein
MPVASRLALALADPASPAAWPVCAALGQDQRLEDAGARRRLLAFAAAHCGAEQLPDVLEDLQICDRRLLGAGAAPLGTLRAARRGCCGAAAGLLRGCCGAAAGLAAARSSAGPCHPSKLSEAVARATVGGQRPRPGRLPPPRRPPCLPPAP